MKTQPAAVEKRAAPEDRLQRMFMSSDGTTTALIESYLGESLRAEVWPQRIAHEDEVVHWHGVRSSSSGRLLVRHARLVGVRTGIVAAFARSLIDVSNFPDNAKSAILEGDALLGHIFRSHKIEQYRTVVDSGRGRPPWLVAESDVESLPWRTVVIHVRQRPAATITEWFAFFP